jgi:hypothetical protein
MSTANKQFQANELKQIDQADDLKIAPFREDGKTYGTPTWIWEVVVNGNLYVRAYNGVSSRWYKQTIFKLIDKMLTNKKFKDFFNKNIAAL